MSFAASVFHFVTTTMQNAGYPGIFGLMVLALVVSLPSEIILPFAGYLVFESGFNFWLVLIIASAGSVVGTVIDYAIGYFLGRPTILRYGRYIHLNERSLVTSEKWFMRYGSPTVFLTRFVPLIRTVVAFPAGIGRMSMRKYLAYSAVGLVFWNAALIYIGYIVGPSVNSIIDFLSSSFTIVEILAVIVAVFLTLIWLRKSNKKSKDSLGGQSPSNLTKT
jgi:membrane protein DedA with SNARE-associated domain